MRAEMGEKQILTHGEVWHDGLAPPILGDEADAGADRLRWRAGSERSSFIQHFAAGAGPEAEQRLDRLGSAQGFDPGRLAPKISPRCKSNEMPRQHRGAQPANGQGSARRGGLTGADEAA